MSRRDYLLINTITKRDVERKGKGKRKSHLVRQVFIYGMYLNELTESSYPVCELCVIHAIFTDEGTEGLNG